MNIGLTIKKLRKEHNITQEKFAEYLNISPQAISRWENGSALPDISALPAIADFFGVSTDLLFGLKKDKREETIENYLKEYQKLCTTGDIAKRLSLISEAKKRFPGEFRILICYAETLAASPYSAPEGNLLITQEELLACKNKVIDICQNIIDDCTLDDIRYRALDLLSLTYCEIGDTENAIKVANKLPDYSHTKNMMLYRIFDYDTHEHISFYQENIENIVLDLWLWIRSAVWGTSETKKKTELCHKALGILELMYEDKDFGYGHTIIAQIYQHIAMACISAEEYDSALDALEKYISHQIAFMELPAEFCHTSLLFNHLKFSKNELVRSYTCSEAEVVINSLENKIYDPVRNTERFKNILRQLLRYK